MPIDPGPSSSASANDPSMPDRDSEALGRSLGAPDVPAAPIPRAAPPAENSAASHIGEAAGGLSGALTGAAIGSVGGPVGTLIGGIAGAVGGWWAGRAIADAAVHFSDVDDAYYRRRYAAFGAQRSNRAYEDVRAAYQIGHLASLNPEYAGREFEEIEPDLRHGWRSETVAETGAWEEARPYARDAFADASSRRVIGPDAERPIAPVVDGEELDAASDEADAHVELSEAADPQAFGDGTSVTGYADGLSDDRPV